MNTVHSSCIELVFLSSKMDLQPVWGLGVHCVRLRASHCPLLTSIRKKEQAQTDALGCTQLRRNQLSAASVGAIPQKPSSARDRNYTAECTLPHTLCRVQVL